MRQESTSVAFSSLAGYPPQRPVTPDNPSWGLSIPEIVDPRNVQVLHRPEDAELTLLTWYRFILGSVPKRFIVHARQQYRVRAHKHRRYFDRAPGPLVVHSD